MATSRVSVGGQIILVALLALVTSCFNSADRNGNADAGSRSGATSAANVGTGAGRLPLASKPPAPPPNVSDAGSDLALSVTLGSSTKPGRLVADIMIHNRGTSDLLVMDRLWSETSMGKRTWDANVAYRFVHDGSLWLFFGPAPFPANLMPHEDYFPQATRLAPGATTTHRIELEPPVKEYNIVLEGLRQPVYDPVLVDTITVIVQYARPEDCLYKQPSFLDPAAVSIGSYPMRTRSAQAQVRVPPFQVMRRRDAFERPMLTEQ